jgi:hypothetical protein
VPDDRTDEELIAVHDAMVRRAVQDGFLPPEFANFALQLRTDEDKVRIAKGQGIENDPASAAFQEWLSQQQKIWIRRQLGEGENGA